MNKIIMLILFSYSIVIAENIDGPANVRNTPNGNIKYVLNDSIFVHAYELNNNWFEILVTAFIRKSDVEKDGILKIGSVLYNSDLITQKGITKDTINISGWWQESNNPEYIEAMIYGYTFKGNIRSNSIIEREIERVTKSKKYSELFELFDRFGFNEYKLDGYNVYALYDDAAPWASNDFRIIVYFTSKNELIGIANPKRIIDIEYMEKGKIDRDFNMYYLISLDETVKKDFEKYVTVYFASRD